MLVSSEIAEQHRTLFLSPFIFFLKDGAKQKKNRRGEGDEEDSEDEDEDEAEEDDGDKETDEVEELIESNWNIMQYLPQSASCQKYFLMIVSGKIFIFRKYEFLLRFLSTYSYTLSPCQPTLQRSTTA